MSKKTQEKGKTVTTGVKEGLAAEKDPAPVVKDTTTGTMVSTEQARNILDESIERQLTRMGRVTAEALRKSPAEKVVVPEDRLNKNDDYVVVGVNGWNLQIQRGVPVVLPAPVVDLLARGGYAPTLVR